MTTAQFCKYRCGTRIILAINEERPGKPLPALNFGRDPQGAVAARQHPSLAWTGRFIAAHEALPGPEYHRYAVHACTQQHAAERQAWAKAAADLHRDQRNRRGHRPPPQVTGYVVQPPTLPGVET